MGFHYRYNASGAHRWGVCHAFKVLEGRAPKKVANHAMKLGTATHFLGEWALTNGYHTALDERLLSCYVRIDAKGDALDIVTGPGGQTPSVSMSGIPWVENPSQATPELPDIFPVDETMIQAVVKYVDIVNGILLKYKHKVQQHVEIGFQLAPDMGGIADLVIQTPNRLIVLDYKNGRQGVGAEDNPQLAMYGVGALSKFAMASDIHDVVMGIVQPHAPGPTLKTWLQTTNQLKGWRDKFEAARFECEKVRLLDEAGKPIDDYCTTGEHCKWCPAIGECPAKHKDTMALAQRTINDLGAPNMPDVAGLDDQRLLWIANHGESIIEFIEECKGRMTTQAVADGKVWPGFKIVESDTKRRLKDKKAIENAFKAKGLMEAFEPKLKALSKLEKIFGKDKMAHLIEKPAGKPVMVRVSDGRQPINQSMVAQLPDIKD